MKNSAKTLLTVNKLLVMAFFALFLPFQQLSAQAKKGGGNKPSVGKPAANKNAVSKPAANRPSVEKSSVKTPDVNRPEASKSSANRPSVNKPDTKGIGGKDSRADVPGNRNNNVNIDNSKKNVNVNVDKSKDIHINNSRNTSVRRNTRVYSRPPYVYGGRRYRCYHPYYFHPYRPYVWGPRWHPWGFFIATLATTAIIVSIVDNDMDMPGNYDMALNYFSDNGLSSVDKHLLRSGPAILFGPGNPGYGMRWTRPEKLAIDGEYYYDEGVYYLKGNGGYTVVSAPVGAKIKTLPSGYETVSADDDGTKNYYYGGAFYEKRSDGYVVVTPLAGTIVENVSEGGEEVKMGDITYIKFGETYFQPVQVNGKDMYEVADVEDDK